jgi:hypothetical protein
MLQELPRSLHPIKQVYFWLVNSNLMKHFIHELPHAFRACVEHGNSHYLHVLWVTSNNFFSLLLYNLFYVLTLFTTDAYELCLFKEIAGEICFKFYFSSLLLCFYYIHTVFCLHKRIGREGKYFRWRAS